VAFLGQPVPAGFEKCEGGVSQLSTLLPVFAGRTPDLRSRVIVGSGSGSGRTPRVAGEVGGAAMVNLTAAQLPSHSHSMQLGVITAFGATPPQINYVMASDSVDVGTLDISTAHSNIGQSLVIRWIMAVTSLPPPVGSAVHYVTALTAADPGEMRVVGQQFGTARQDLKNLGLTQMPDSQDAFLIGFDSANDLTGRIGEGTHALTGGEIPSHSHKLLCRDVAAGGNFSEISLPGRSGVLGVPVYYTGSATISLAADALLQSGASDAHENMHPYLVMDVIAYNSETCALQGSVCSCDLISGVCAAQTNGSAPIVVSEPTVFPGDVILTPSSNLIVNVSAGAALTVSGNVLLNGTLTLLVSGVGTVTVVSAGSISGQFSAVAIVPQYANCSEVTGVGSYSSTTLTVTVTSPPCGGAMGDNVPIGLILGIVLGIVVVAIVAAVIGVLLHHRRTQSAMQNARSKISGNSNLIAMKTVA
jgi:microcystin-dependent protein